MAATAQVSPPTRPPGPPELLPGRPDAIVDLQTDEGVALVGGQWRYSDARVEETGFVELGSPEDPLGPGTVPNRTYDIAPHAEAADFDDSGWTALAPGDTMRRLADRAGLLQLVSDRGHTARADRRHRGGRLDGRVRGRRRRLRRGVGERPMPHALGDSGGPVVAGFNAPNRVVLTRDARPGEHFTIAVFGINGPISAAPANYIWMRTATLDVYAGARDRPDGIERVAGGFEFTEGPVWSADGALLFSSPNTNSIYRLDPELERVTLFRPKSGYTGADIGRYLQPGSNGLTFDPAGRLVMCQHGNRRILRVNPHGDTSVIADAYEGRRLNSPNDVVCRSDASVWFTDPPFGRPGMADDPDRELDFSGVFRVSPDGTIALIDDSLEGPNGIAFSPDERTLYVGNWDPDSKVVVRYELSADGDVLDRSILFDMTDAPGEDAIDGLKVDAAGNLYVCGPGGIWVISPQGERLDLIELPEAPHNLAFGGEDARDLYVTALTSVYRLRTDVPGINPHTERSRR